jgi:hypothetical protein
LLFLSSSFVWCGSMISPNRHAWTSDFVFESWMVYRWPQGEWLPLANRLGGFFLQFVLMRRTSTVFFF